MANRFYGSYRKSPSYKAVKRADRQQKREEAEVRNANTPYERTARYRRERAMRYTRASAWGKGLSLKRSENETV